MGLRQHAAAKEEEAAVASAELERVREELDTAAAAAAGWQAEASRLEAVLKEPPPTRDDVLPVSAPQQEVQRLEAAAAAAAAAVTRAEARLAKQLADHKVRPLASRRLITPGALGPPSSLVAVPPGHMCTRWLCTAGPEDTGGVESVWWALTRTRGGAVFVRRRRRDWRRSGWRARTHI